MQLSIIVPVYNMTGGGKLKHYLFIAACVIGREKYEG